MNFKILALLGFLLLSLSYGCEDTGPEPIDMPDPTDTMPSDTMPMDTVPVDTPWKILINEVKGSYLGTCYIHNMSPMPYFDTLYNVTVTIDSLERILGHDDYYYILTDGSFTFVIPEPEFVQDTVDAFTLGGNQTYTKTIQLIRSQRFLYTKRGVYPGIGFMITECYCTKE